MDSEQLTRHLEQSRGACFEEHRAWLSQSQRRESRSTRTVSSIPDLDAPAHDSPFGMDPPGQDDYHILSPHRTTTTRISQETGTIRTTGTNSDGFNAIADHEEDTLYLPFTPLDAFAAPEPDFSFPDDLIDDDYPNPLTDTPVMADIVAGMHEIQAQDLIEDGPLFEEREEPNALLDSAGLQSLGAQLEGGRKADEPDFDDDGPSEMAEVDSDDQDEEESAQDPDARSWQDHLRTHTIVYDGAAIALPGLGHTLRERFRANKLFPNREATSNIYFPFKSKDEWELAVTLDRLGVSVGKLNDVLKTKLVSQVTYIE